MWTLTRNKANDLPSKRCRSYRFFTGRDTASRVEWVGRVVTRWSRWREEERDAEAHKARGAFEEKQVSEQHACIEKWIADGRRSHQLKCDARLRTIRLLELTILALSSCGQEKDKATSEQVKHINSLSRPRSNGYSHPFLLPSSLSASLFLSLFLSIELCQFLGPRCLIFSRIQCETDVKLFFSFFSFLLLLSSVFSFSLSFQRFFLRRFRNLI